MRWNVHRKNRRSIQKTAWRNNGKTALESKNLTMYKAGPATYHGCSEGAGQNTAPSKRRIVLPGKQGRQVRPGPGQEEGGTSP